MLPQRWRVNNNGSLLQVNENFDNNENKVCLFLMLMKLVGHVLDYVIVNCVTTILQLLFFLA